MSSKSPNEGLSTAHGKNSDPKIWGPSLWKFMHLMADAYPETPNDAHAESAKQFFISLRYLLPCEKCRTHYSSLLDVRPPETQTGQKLQEWVLWLHNEINNRVSKSKPWTLAEVKKKTNPTPLMIPKVQQKPPPPQRYPKRNARPISVQRKIHPAFTNQTNQRRRRLSAMFIKSATGKPRVAKTIHITPPSASEKKEDCGCNK